MPDDLALVEQGGAELRSVNNQYKPWQFKAGQSGNPAGRPKTVLVVRDLARQYTEESIRGLAAIARDKKQPGATRAYCYTELLNRGHGKAPQKYEVEVSIFDSLSPEQRAVLDVALELLLQRQAIDVTPKP